MRSCIFLPSSVSAFPSVRPSRPRTAGDRPVPPSEAPRRPRGPLPVCREGRGPERLVLLVSRRPPPPRVHPHVTRGRCTRNPSCEASGTF